MKKAYLAFAVLLMVMVFVSGCTKEYDSGGSADSLEAGEDPSKALYTAIKEHDLKATEPAVGEGADVNSFSQNVKSEMKEATGAARTSLRYALERGSLAPDVVELLVDKGADVDYADPKSKETYLMYCASKKKPGLADLLLENGTDVNTQDADGKTALSFAIFGEYRDCSSTEQIVRELLYYDADVKRKAVKNVLRQDICVDSPYIGCTQFRLAHLLLEKTEEQGGLKKINIDDHLKAAFTGNNDVLIPYLKGKKSFDEKEFRVVLACAASDDTEAVGEYLKNNDIDRASRDGVTMLMAADSCGAGSGVELLMKEGADLAKQDKDGSSAAVKAQEYREYDIFEKIKNIEGKSR